MPSTHLDDESAVHGRVATRAPLVSSKTADQSSRPPYALANLPHGTQDSSLGRKTRRSPMPVTAKPSPFRIMGGRTGTISYRVSDTAAELSWEMLAGDIEMVIYASECRWTAPSVRAMSADEVIAIVRQLATALPGRIEVAFDGTSQV